MNDGFDFCYDYEKELTPTRSLRTQNNYSTDSLKRQFEYLESLMEMSDSEEFEDEITRTYSTGGLRDVAVPLPPRSQDYSLDSSSDEEPQTKKQKRNVISQESS